MVRTPSYGFCFSLALGLAIIVIVGVFQIDRAARQHPALVRLVPDGLGGFADQQRFKMLLQHDADAAEPFISAVIAHRPIDGEYIAQAALLAIEQGDEGHAAKALTVAANRGWRNEFVQVSVLAAAALQGRPKDAALRLDALSRIEASDAVIFRALEALLLQPATAQEIGPLIAESDYLARSIVRFAERTPERAKDLARIVAKLDTSEDALGCEGRARIGYGLLSKGNAIGADFWPQSCGDLEQNGLAFEYGRTEIDPFAWVFPNSGGVSIRLQKGGTLTVENRDFLRRLVAWKYLTLVPGRYMLRSQRNDSASAAPTGRRRAEVFISVRCIDQAGRESLTLGSINRIPSLEFIVDADCPVQRLRIEADRGRVDRLRLELRKN